MERRKQILNRMKELTEEQSLLIEELTLTTDDRKPWGINLGQMFENPARSPDKAIDLVRKYATLGFTHLRIPCTYGMMFCNMPLESPKFQLLLGVITFAIHSGMKVMINFHHERWLYDTYDGSQAMDERIFTMARLLAGQLKHFPADKIIFECLNEPQGVYGQWGRVPTPEDSHSIQLCRQVNASIYWGIRSVLPDHIVLVSPNGMANLHSTCMVYPTRDSLPGEKDTKVGLSLHNYDPWQYTGQSGDDRFFSHPEDARKFVKSGFDRFMKDVPYYRYIPLHMTEFGVGRMHGKDESSEILRAYYDEMVRGIRNMEGIPYLWNDGDEEQDPGAWFAHTNDFMKWLLTL